MRTIVFEHLKEYLDGCEYPIQRNKVVKYAKLHHAPEEVLMILEKLQDKEYKDIYEIREGLLMIPLDDGVPKKDEERMAQKHENKLQTMKNVVNLNDFTQMGDEEDHESV